MLLLITIFFAVVVHATLPYEVYSDHFPVSIGLLDDPPCLNLHAYPSDLAPIIPDPSQLSCENASSEIYSGDYSASIKVSYDSPGLTYSSDLAQVIPDPSSFCYIPININSYSEFSVTEIGTLSDAPDWLLPTSFKNASLPTVLKPLNRSGLHSLIRKRRNYCHTRSFFNSCSQKYIVNRFTVLYPRSNRKRDPKEPENTQKILRDQPMEGNVLPSFNQRFQKYK